MPPSPKDSQYRDDEEVDREANDDAPRVDESEIEPDDRTAAKAEERTGDEEVDDDMIEDIDLDDLAAMEGPDA